MLGLATHAYCTCDMRKSRPGQRGNHQGWQEELFAHLEVS